MMLSTKDVCFEGNAEDVLEAQGYVCAPKRNVLGMPGRVQLDSGGVMPQRAVMGKPWGGKVGMRAPELDARSELKNTNPLCQRKARSAA